jgi:cytoskeletal protein RodZ
MKKRFLFVLLVTLTACSQPRIESKIPTTPVSPTTIPETPTSPTIAPEPTSEPTSEPLATPTPISTASEEDTTQSVDKPATLTSLEPGSRINVRTRASTSAKVRHHGFAGDSVAILREVTGDDGIELSLSRMIRKVGYAVIL